MSNLSRFRSTYHTGLGSGFHGNLAVGVDLKAGIKDTVRDLVAQFVGVTLTHGFGGKVKEAFLVVVSNLHFRVFRAD